MNIEKNSVTKATGSHQSPQSQQNDTLQHENESIYQNWNDLINRTVFPHNCFQ